MAAERIHLTIGGRVQGVCYRMFCRDEARRLGVTGTVRNQGDGSVAVTAEGEPDALRRLTAWCRKGPAFAHVTDVEIREAPATGQFSEFDIAY